MSELNHSGRRFLQEIVSDQTIARRRKNAQIGEQFRTAYSGGLVGLLNERVAFQLPCELFGAPHYFFERLINGRSPHQNDPLRNFQLRDIDGPSIRDTAFTYHASTPSRQVFNILVSAQITCPVRETIRDTNVTRHIIRRQLTTRLTARSAHSRLTHYASMT